ncbi:MAG: GHMP kinase [Chloroflexi bacterium]|nr:GHMP kinase [Chloroflexota bacterium]
MSRAAAVWLPGTCGELVQGAIGGQRFLVSCPIDVFARVAVELAPRAPIAAPPDGPKAAAALRATLAHCGAAALGGRLTLDSPLPRGKGLGSSTADVAGAIYATLRALGRPADPATVAALAVGVEPTNSSLFPGLALFDHRSGARYEPLGAAPPLEVIVLDEGGAVDTLAFNRRDAHAVLAANEPQVREALALVRRGLAEGRSDLLGRGATLSAQAHQRVLPKRWLAAVLDAATEAGAIGVVAAHSGTVLGALVDPARAAAPRVLAALHEAAQACAVLFVCRLADGGPRWRRPVCGSAARGSAPPRGAQAAAGGALRARQRWPPA